jgi:negative regulator of sigma-B (phosphoserine phosphatase)
MPHTKRKAKPLLDWGVASVTLPGERVSGDQALVQPFPKGMIVGVVDGLGHGTEAATAAQRAIATLEAHAHESVVFLIKRCHEELKGTRGVVMTLASFNAADETITWVGVGNIEAILFRADPHGGPAREYVLLHGGVVGHHLPPLRGFVIPVSAGDTLIVTTDGIRSGFAEGLTLDHPPKKQADQILARHAKGTDDALVLVARYLGRGGS